MARGTTKKAGSLNPERLVFGDIVDEDRFT